MPSECAVMMQIASNYPDEDLRDTICWAYMHVKYCQVQLTGKRKKKRIMVDERYLQAAKQPRDTCVHTVAFELTPEELDKKQPKRTSGLPIYLYRPPLRNSPVRLKIE